jgi:hypothetical protein
MTTAVSVCSVKVPVEPQTGFPDVFNELCDDYLEYESDTNAWNLIQPLVTSQAVHKCSNKLQTSPFVTVFNRIKGHTIIKLGKYSMGMMTALMKTHIQK